MTTREDLLKYADRRMREQRKKGLPAFKPIYQIIIFEHPNKQETINGEPINYPDTGAIDYPGFFYSLNEAVEAMHKNTMYMHEGIYFAGFITCRFPGVYSYCLYDISERIYFLYDKKKNGFYEAEEPEIFRDVAF